MFCLVFASCNMLPSQGSPKSSYGLGWRGTSNLSWGLAALNELRPCQEAIFFKSKQVFYQIKYLHTKLYFWCQAGSPIFFFHVACFVQLPPPSPPCLLTMIQTGFTLKVEIEKQTFLMGGDKKLSFVMSCTHMTTIH